MHLIFLRHFLLFLSHYLFICYLSISISPSFSPLFLCHYRFICLSVSFYPGTCLYLSQFSSSVSASLSIAPYRYTCLYLSLISFFFSFPNHSIQFISEEMSEIRLGKIRSRKKRKRTYNTVLYSVCLKIYVYAFSQ